MPPTVPPERIGRYVVEGELGRGAMGVVYRGRDPRIDRHVAIKTLGAMLDIDPETAQQVKDRFLNEGRAAGRLSHPGIVTVYDADEDPATGIAYLAMEMVDGTDLKAVLAMGVAPERLLDLLGEVAAALDHAHSRGVIHRDVKPANILVPRDGHAKLTDFGIARLASSTMTQTGQFLGSPSYMSPEQVRSRPVTPATDIFSLAIVVYEGLTGRKPFQGDDIASTTHAIANEEPERPSAVRESISPAMDAVLAKGLAKRPEDRYPTASALAQAARAALSGDGGATAVAGPTTVRSPVPRRRLLAGGLAGAVLLSAVVVWLLASRRGDGTLPAPPESTDAAARASAPAAADPSLRAPVPARSSPPAEAAPVAARRDDPQRGPAAAIAPAPAHLRVDISTLLPGTIVVRAGEAEVGRRPVGELRRRGPKLKNPKMRFDVTFDVPAGRQDLTFLFIQDNRKALASRRTVDFAPGQTRRATVDVGALGFEMEVRVQ